MSQSPEQPPRVNLGELRRVEGSETPRDAPRGQPRKPSAINLVGVGILVALVPVGALAVASGQSAGEQGIGVVIICCALLLLAVEIVYWARQSDAPIEGTKNGDGDD